MTAPARLLQITDCHLLTRPGATLLGVDTARTLEAVLEQALAEHVPDALLATGDLAHDPEDAAAYRRFRELVEAHYRGPLLALAGNHDVGAPLAAELDVDAALRLGGWEVVCFDTHRDGQAEAEFGAPARRALEARLSNSSGAYLLAACHHPPLAVGCPWLDKDCIPGGDEVLESLAAAAGPAMAEAPATRLRALVCGHVHQEFRQRRAGVEVLAAPSTCFQFEPGSRRFTVDRGAETGMPGYRWIELAADGGLTTRVQRLSGGPPRRGGALNIDFSRNS